MIQAIGIGIITAILISLPAAFRAYLQGTWLASPGWILLVGVLAMLLQKWILDRRFRDSQYHGLADLLIYVHKPVAQGTSLSWAVHGLISFLLSLVGGLVGAEGAAIEWMQAIQMRVDAFSVKWFEQKRRTHVGSILAASVGAAFGAPFSGLLLTFELGIGGRSLTAAMSALTAFLGARWLTSRFLLPQVGFHGVLPHFNFLNWTDWVGLLLVGVVGGAMGAFLIFVIRYTHESLNTLFKFNVGFRLFGAAVLLFFVRWVSVGFGVAPEIIMEHALWSKLSLSQMSFVLITQFLIVSLLVGGVGTIGWIWPVVSLGAVMGCTVFQVLPQEVLNLAPAAGLAGASALWAVVLNAPLSGAILALELTQEFQFVLPVWCIAWLAIRVRNLLRVSPLLEYDLVARGHGLYLGRSTSVMNSIFVKNAMVTDYTSVHEHETEAEVHARASQSHYPFLPVVSRDGRFLGLLTTDLILFETSLEPEERSTHRKVMEAKDLAYRFGVKTPTVHLTDSLKSVVHWLDEFPCLPVLGADHKLVGLLLVSHVRLAYEREVGRRSFDFVPKEKNG